MKWIVILLVILGLIFPAQCTAVDTLAVGQGYVLAQIRDTSVKAFGKKRMSEYSDRQLADLPKNKRQTFSVLVVTDVSPDSLIRILQRVVDDRRKADPDLDEIHVNAYDRSEDLGYEATYGRAHWHPSDGVVTPNIASKNLRQDYTTRIWIRGKVGGDAPRPTKREFEIFDAYTKVIDDPKQLSKLKPPSHLYGDALNKWQDVAWERRESWKKEQRERIAREYGVTPDEVREIWGRIEFWKGK